MADSDGFRLVKSRNPKRRPPDRCSSSSAVRVVPARREPLGGARDDVPSLESEDGLYKLVSQCREDVRQSGFWPRLLATTRTAVAELQHATDGIAGVSEQASAAAEAELRHAAHDSRASSNSSDDMCSIGVFERVVAYGVGSFSSCAIARHQLALLLLVAESLCRSVNAVDGGGGGSSGSSSNPGPAVEAYDPVFSELERRVLERFSVEAIGTNEEGKRAVSHRTLFFMPHCPKALYNNVLWANWDRDRLAHAVLLGNSFSAIELATPSRQLRTSFEYLARAAQIVTEYRVENCFKFPDVFNDLSVHVFCRDRLLPACISGRGPEPFYDDEDELIRAERC